MNDINDNDAIIYVFDQVMNHVWNIPLDRVIDYCTSWWVYRSLYMPADQEWSRKESLNKLFPDVFHFNILSGCFWYFFTLSRTRFWSSPGISNPSPQTKSFNLRLSLAGSFLTIACKFLNTKACTLLKCFHLLPGFFLCSQGIMMSTCCPLLNDPHVR